MTTFKCCVCGIGVENSDFENNLTNKIITNYLIDKKLYLCKDCLNKIVHKEAFDYAETVFKYGHDFIDDLLLILNRQKIIFNLKEAIEKGKEQKRSENIIEQYRKLQEENDKLKDIKKYLIDTIQNQKIKCEGYKEKIDAIEEKVQQLEENHNFERNLNKKYDERIQELQQERSNLIKENEKLTMKVEGALGEIQYLVVKNDKMIKEINENDSYIYIDRCQEKNEKLLKESETKTLQINACLKKIDELEEEVDRLEKEVKEIEFNYYNIQKHNLSVYEVNEKLIKENQKLKDTIISYKDGGACKPQNE